MSFLALLEKRKLYESLFRTSCSETGQNLPEGVLLDLLSWEDWGSQALNLSFIHSLVTLCSNRSSVPRAQRGPFSATGWPHHYERNYRTSSTTPPGNPARHHRSTSPASSQPSNSCSKKNIITPTSHGTTKSWYENLIETAISPGLLELQRPKLDWQTTWRWIAATKGKNRDILFLFNHNILPTQIRNQRRDITIDSTCPICRCLDEDNIHLVLLCPKKGEAVDWLRSQLATLRCHSPLRNAIHGNLGNCPNPRHAGALIEAFIVGTWEARQRQAAPPVAELEGLWKALLHQRKLTLPPYH